MSQYKEKEKRSLVIKTVTAGLVSSVLYVLLLVYQDIIMEYFTMGGYYSLLPILAAFVFSSVHGYFTGSFWSALGIDASRQIKGDK